ncbi:putative uncharacterized protein DDB_G0282129 [Physella acuta]|uniref:putative uncharacterized protein DDB_G0282129 n=1 Tax=Physella acuta TaxID=109671 RepID=UPI0027DB9B4F|nr:putative uncharacterized protein DDB_G0282129 [Physella acuta]
MEVWFDESGELMMSVSNADVTTSMDAARLKGRFPMNPEICVLWVASDVLMCSASIWHMCTMSMDRYFTLNYPMRYGRNKTRRMVAGKILFVWLVSMAISSPVCIHGFIDTSIVYNDGMCVPVLKNFIIYGSIFAFYIPLLIMIVTYVLTIRILWNNQQRMKHIDRSDLKPRLAQLTAQCTGFAIPKLLSNLKRPSKSPSTSQTSISNQKCDKRVTAPDSATTYSVYQFENVNNTVSDCDLRTSGRNGNKPQMSYLAPPNQTCAVRSTSKSSTRFQETSDTEDSESEPNYFSMLQSSQSCRSLTTPISLTTSEKSLQKRLHKKQLLQQQQQEIRHLCKSYGTQNPETQSRDESSLSPSPPEISKNITLNLPSPSPQHLPLTDQKPQNQYSLPDSPDSVFPSSSSCSLLRLKDKKETTTKKTPKRKRLSKRGRKRQSSLNEKDRANNLFKNSTIERPNNFLKNSATDRPNHLLEVPGPVFNRRGRTNKQTNGLTLLSTAKSDTQVSKAGRETTTEGDASFHLSYSNLSKDYKSAEWDRRYFQIQAEMDQCLMEEFGRWERRQSTVESDDNKSGSDKSVKEHKPLLEPESSLPIYLIDPLNVQGIDPTCYSHSAPNSPLNRRTMNSSLTQSSSDSDSGDSADRAYNKDNSDKTNDDDDTSGSSNNDDVITIRLHPPSPKVKSVLNNSVSSLRPIENGCGVNGVDNNNHSQNEAYPSVHHIENEATPTHNCDNHNGSIPSCAKNNPNNSYVSTLKPAHSSQSLSPVSSTLPELVISSEGEMTLEETDDTLDDSPKSNRIKLRRPHQTLHQNKQRFRKKLTSPKREFSGDTFSKSLKRPSFRNTFRIHRGKAPSKHILSKKTASNEKKASKVLGIIFLVFVILWTPFFTVNILSATCASCITNVTQEMMSLFLWMGYIASLANPIIYTMFNTAFRRTFIRILTCKIQRTCGTAKNSDNPYMSYTTMLASERRNTMTVVLRDESR